MATGPAIFKWRQTGPVLILSAVRWYLRYSLSLRDVEELLKERGLEVDHTTVWRWLQRYGPELEERLRRYLKPTNKSWRVDETYVRVKGRWCYLYRAIDSAGPTIDFLLSAFRDADAAKRLFRKALSHPSHPWVAARAAAGRSHLGATAWHCGAESVYRLDERSSAVRGEGRNSSLGRVIESPNAAARQVFASSAGRS
jgi:transposase, IS6 family